MQRRLRHHKNYLHIYDVLDKRLSMATMEELASHDDRCAICWEKMYTAYKLPCGHLSTSSQIANWLPGFTVEFVHSSNMIILLQADDSQVHQEEEMFHQVDLPE